MADLEYIVALKSFMGKMPGEKVTLKAHQARAYKDMIGTRLLDPASVAAGKKAEADIAKAEKEETDKGDTTKRKSASEAASKAAEEAAAPTPPKK